jgi:hypothetical protein
MPQSQRGNPRPTFDLNSDKSRYFNHRDELDSTVQLPNFRSVTAHYKHTAALFVICLLYIAQSSFVYMWNYVSQGNA